MARPPSINQLHHVDDDGRRWTVGEEIVRQLGAGGYVETAAAVAGCHKDTLYAWLKRGARAQRAALRAGKAVPAAERRYVEFTNAVDRATGEAEARDVALLAQLARGGRQVEHTTEKFVRDADGNERLVERSTRIETLAPNPTVLIWRLERRFSKRWGHRGSLEVTGADGAPLLGREARAAELAAAVADFQAGVAAGLAEADHRNGDRAE